ncbi:hypothetical protein FS837_008128 [Tulasnella sp. UAMH 9824]|nr:hypothetical protein FS837_008128 [Tulasnella sp. UAMH 9824]
MEDRIRPVQQSPILHLPEDLTYEIFLACYRDNPRNFAGIASSVCSWWRHIALSIPALWSTIHFDKSLQDQQVIRRLEGQLNRARTAPLDIHIFGSAIHHSPTEGMSKVCRLIFPFITTWRSLVIRRDVRKTALRALLDRLKNSSAPTLEELVIEPVPAMSALNIDINAERELIVSRSNIPRLRSLRLSRCIYDWSLDIFDDLLDLEIHNDRLARMSPSELVAIVQNLIVRSPRLRRLVLTDGCPVPLLVRPDRPPPLPQQETLFHGAIEYLRIPLCRGEVTDAILHTVIMPTLEDMGIESGTSYFILPFSFSTLAYFNPLPNLRHIRIHGLGGSSGLTPHESAALPLALQAMSGLESLKFFLIDLTGSETWLPDLLVWLPRLTSLTFDRCKGLLDSAIREMVERCSHPESLDLVLFSTVQTERPSRGSQKVAMKELILFLTSRLEKYSPFL